MTKTKQNCISYKAIHYNTVKTIYNITIKKNTRQLLKDIQKKLSSEFKLSLCLEQNPVSYNI